MADKKEFFADSLEQIHFAGGVPRKILAEFAIGAAIYVGIEITGGLYPRDEITRMETVQTERLGTEAAVYSRYYGILPERLQRDEQLVLKTADGKAVVAGVAENVELVAIKCSAHFICAGNLVGIQFVVSRPFETVPEIDYRTLSHCERVCIPAEKVHRHCH